jgi:hypothetical protein
LRYCSGAAAPLAFRCHYIAVDVIGLHYTITAALAVPSAAEREKAIKIASIDPNLVFKVFCRCARIHFAFAFLSALLIDLAKQTVSESKTLNNKVSLLRLYCSILEQTSKIFLQPYSVAACCFDCVAVSNIYAAFSSYG